MAVIIYGGPPRQRKRASQGEGPPRTNSSERSREDPQFAWPLPAPMPVSQSAWALAIVAILETTGPLPRAQLAAAIPACSEPDGSIDALLAAGVLEVGRDGRSLELVPDRQP